MMAKKTLFADPKISNPESGTVCCYHCRFANHVLNLPSSMMTNHQRFVECRHSPPSVVVMPAGIDQTTGQIRAAIQSKFPVMGYVEFCHRFEFQTDVKSD